MRFAQHAGGRALSPTNKVTGAAAGTPFAIIIAWLIETWTGATVPTEVAISFGSLAGAFVAYLVNDKATTRSS